MASPPNLFSILVLSDIHFIKDVDVDTNAELSEGVLEFATEIRSRFGKVNVIAVCGDIAYSGREEEYARASDFLRNLELVLGGPRILVIPGNHDIFRPATRSAEQSVMRNGPRQKTLSDGDRDKELADILADPRKGQELLEPLEAYLKFAAQFGCSFDPSRPFWEIGVPISDRLDAQFRGLTSVLVSDDNDCAFRLLLSRMQTASIPRKDRKDLLALSLCHHPFEWLLDGESQRQLLDRRCALQVSGHVHRQQVRPTPSGLHLQSGAMQPDRREQNWESRVNLITIETITQDNLANLRLEVHAACWKQSEDRYVWELGPPRPGFASTPLSATPKPPTAAADIDRLRRRLANLSPSDQFFVAIDAGLEFPALAELPESAIVAAMIEQAKDKHSLRALWEEVERRHGNQKRRENPF